MAPYQLGRSFADMMYFDTHAHLTDERFDADRAALMEVLPKRGLAFALDVACALQDFPKTHALTQAYSWVLVPMASIRITLAKCQRDIWT